jgi:nucleoside-diphosphate-sugar epimerase
MIDMTQSDAGEGAILVTGIGGLIGSALVRKLLALNRPLVGMDVHPGTHYPFPVLAHNLPDPHRWHEVLTRNKISKIVHAGGVSGPMLYRDAPGTVVDINLSGLMGLLEAVRINGSIQRLVWMSSITAYGDRQDRQLPVVEDSVLRPTSVYGGTKAAGEAMLEAYCNDYGLNAVSLRVASCYGPGRTTTCLIRKLLEDGLAKRVSVIKNTSDITRQFVYVDDVVDGIISALDMPSTQHKVYNIAPGRSQSLAEIVQAIQLAVPEAKVIERDDGFFGGAYRLGPLSIDAASRELDFSPSTPLSEGVLKTLNWVKQQTITNKELS